MRTDAIKVALTPDERARATIRAAQDYKEHKGRNVFEPGTGDPQDVRILEATVGDAALHSTPGEERAPNVKATPISRTPDCWEAPEQGLGAQSTWLARMTREELAELNGDDAPGAMIVHRGPLRRARTGRADWWEDHGCTSALSGRREWHEDEGRYEFAATGAHMIRTPDHRDLKAYARFARALDAGHISPEQAPAILDLLLGGQIDWENVDITPTRLTAEGVERRMNEIAPGGWRVAHMRAVCTKRGRKTDLDHTIRAYAIWLCHWMRHVEGASPGHLATALGVTPKTISEYFDPKKSKPQLDRCRMLIHPSRVVMKLNPLTAL